MRTVNIAWNLAPTNSFEAFKKWHGLACVNHDKNGKLTATGDPLSAEDRWKLKPKK